MSVPEDLRQAIQQRYNVEDLRVTTNSSTGDDEVHAYGMLPDTTIMGWYSLGDLDELEKELREKGEL